MEPVPSTKQLLRWSEALAGIARTGLGFTQSLYEQERFEEVLRVAADIRVAVDLGSEGSEDAEGLVEEWMGSVGKGVPGYVTPKVAVGAAVGNDKGEMLLVQRADSGVWLYPTGWADVGYSAAEYPMSAQPVGYSHTPESARCTSRISPLSLPTAAPTATFGVT